MAPLQKRALYSLIIGIIITVALILVFLFIGDVTAFDKNLNLRLVVYAGFIGVPLIYLIMVNLTLRKPEQIDERDRIIIDKSFRAQWLAAILLLMVWTITLSEVYWYQGQIPVVYLTLIMVSIFIFSTLAKSIGILIGYRSINRNA